MPIYEYRCLQCGERFQKLVRSSNNSSELTCPTCNSESVERLFSVFGTVGSSKGSADARNSSPYCATGLCRL